MNSVMGKVKRGDRVGAIQSANEKEVSLYGYGIYDGNKSLSLLGGISGGVADMLKMMEVKNPRITLDSGKHIFGCECRWGSEKKIKALIGNRKIIMVDIDEERNREIKGCPSLD